MTFEEAEIELYGKGYGTPYKKGLGLIYKGGVGTLWKIFPKKQKDAIRYRAEINERQSYYIDVRDYSTDEQYSLEPFNIGDTKIPLPEHLRNIIL